MSTKRSRTARFCAYLELETLINNVAMSMMKQSSAAIEAPKAKKSMEINRSINLLVHEQTQPDTTPGDSIFSIESAPAQPQIHRQICRGYLANKNHLFPPTFFDKCNYCKSRISADKNIYMNGGLEAYCSPKCRDEFNNMLIRARKLSPKS